MKIEKNKTVELEGVAFRKKINVVTNELQFEVSNI